MLRRPVIHIRIPISPSLLFSVHTFIPSLFLSPPSVLGFRSVFLLLSVTLCIAGEDAPSQVLVLAGWLSPWFSLDDARTITTLFPFRRRMSVQYNNVVYVVLLALP